MDPESRALIEQMLQEEVYYNQRKPLPPATSTAASGDAPLSTPKDSTVQTMGAVSTAVVVASAASSPKSGRGIARGKRRMAYIGPHSPKHSRFATIQAVQREPTIPQHAMDERGRGAVYDGLGMSSCTPRCVRKHVRRNERVTATGKPSLSSSDRATRCKSRITPANWWNRGSLYVYRYTFFFWMLNVR